ncbi:MAG: hypothetical protein IPN15_20595 [Saprospiraceae bacterium]|nr:hypothetical protein [Candidatus Vicinibacter affinis]
MTRKLNIDKACNGTVDRRPAGNSGFAKKRVQWLIEHSTTHQLLWYVDSFVLEIRFFAKPQNVTCKRRTTDRTNINRQKNSGQNANAS